jgi:hypothetical protein
MGVNPMTSFGLGFADPLAGIRALFALLDDCCAILSLRSGALSVTKAAKVLRVSAISWGFRATGCAVRSVTGLVRVGK